jgi:hypothetical protein
MSKLQKGLVEVVFQLVSLTPGGLFFDKLLFAVFEECLNNSQCYHRRIPMYFGLQHLILERLIITNIRNQIQQHNRISLQPHLPNLLMIRHGHLPLSPITIFLDN